MFGSMADQVDEDELGRVEALIHSMTRQERSKPDLINKSRAVRIARGSGRKPKDVLELVERFKQMRTLMGNMGAPGGLLSRIPGLGDMMGGTPDLGLSGAGGMDPGALFAGAGGPGMGGGSTRMRSHKTSDQRKSKRQQARKSRQKSRKKKKK
jgi:signal recognition particle subunit SRP54